MTSPQMAGKTVLVTGATNGIGKVAARVLTQQGARVVIVGRDPAKTERMAAEIGAARFVIADLSVQAQVRQAAKDVLDQEAQLDVLLNNAGMYLNQRQETPDGIEMTWALNHLGYFLLTQELLPLIRATPQARIVNVSSAAHTMGRIRWDDPEFRLGYSGWAAYGQSKLANILFTRELSRRLAGSGITANALHPGMVATGFAHNNGSRISRVFSLLRPFAKTEEQGAQTSIYLSSSPEVAGMSGLYFSNEQPIKPAPQALDDAAAERLWRLSEEYVNR
ncbi:SDR family oxidoreductase [Deinococcus sonorensis]|uniref:SDR family oxidoreductase n=2 Tax=Deinococcus sonorensis TaxID=309891 RepID=A0AAU7UA46_9DEIO